MSDNAASLLVKGIAFAKEGNRREARSFLEWALMEDPDFDQKVKTYLWLSRIEEDPDKRRSYLEEALELDMLNPELRRELAILEGRLKPEEIIDPFRPINPLQPAAEVAPGQVRQYVCPNCAGQMAYDPDAGALVCDQCGHRTAQQEAGGVQEQEFLSAALTARGHRWELPTERTLQCSGCGATFTLPQGHVSGACPFCGSVKVVAATTTQDLIQPEGVVPFQFQQLQAIALARRWLAEQPSRPDDLDQRGTFSRPRPVYLPFWNFNVGVLVPGSRSLRADLLRQLALSYDLKELRPYLPDLLAGWPTEVYQVSLTDAAVDAGMVALTFKLVLLPVWSMEYEYKGDRYSMVINGQTGAVFGDIPRSGWQKALGGLLG